MLIIALSILATASGALSVYFAMRQPPVKGRHRARRLSPVRTFVSASLLWWEVNHYA